MNTTNEKIDAIIEACKMGVSSFDPNVIWWDRVFDMVSFAGGAFLSMLFLYFLFYAVSKMIEP